MIYCFASLIGCNSSIAASDKFEDVFNNVTSLEEESVNILKSTNESEELVLQESVDIINTTDESNKTVLRDSVDTLNSTSTNDSAKLVSQQEKAKPSSLKGFCYPTTYLDVVQSIVGSLRNVCSLDEMKVYNLSSDSEKFSKKIQCVPRTLNETLIAEVQIINSTFLLNKLNSLKNESSSINYCAVVMFYAPWCHFCAKTAPHYNALARVFPGIDVYAMDSITYNK